MPPAVRFALEIHPPDWRFPPGATWIAGWIAADLGAMAVTDLRAWFDGRLFLGLTGLPRPEIEVRLFPHPGPPFAGFSFLLRPHRGATCLRLEHRDVTGDWHEFFRTAITVDAAADPAPEPTALAPQLAALQLALLRRLARDRTASLAGLADETVRDTLAFPLDCEPNPPFHGALEFPRDVGRLRYGLLEVSGWLAHRTQRITRLFALIDAVGVTDLLHGLPREGVDKIFADLPGGDCSQFVGYVDVPAGAPKPTLLKIFADLDDGSRHLAFARRFTSVILQGPEPSLPNPTSRLTFVRAAWALRQAAHRHGAALGVWSDVRTAWRAAWHAYAGETAPRAVALRPLPLPVPDAAAAPLGVLVLTHNLNFEGAPLFLFEYSRHLATLPGWRVRVIAPVDGPLRSRFTAAGLPVEIVEAGSLTRAQTAGEFDAAVAALAARIDWTGVDVLVANTLVAFWGVHLAHRANRPAMLYIHESAPVRRFFAAQLAPALLPRAEQAFGLASRVGFIAAASRPFFAHLERGDTFRVLPSWIDVAGILRYAAEHDAATLRSHHGLPRDAVVFANIGSVCERKGQHLFIRASAQLRATRAAGAPALKFLLVGARPSPYLEVLRHDIKVLGLGEDVIVVEEVADPFPYYRLADVFVCSSFEEAFPRVLMEAAAFSLPIVSTGVSGIPELLGPEDAWLVPAGSAEALADGMRQSLLAHFAGDRTRAERAYATVTARFSAEHSLPLHRALTQEAHAAGSARTKRRLR